MLPSGEGRARAPLLVNSLTYIIIIVVGTPNVLYIIKLLSFL